VPSQETLNIVLADDHEVVRGGLKLLLETEPDFEVVAEAGDIDAARRCVREHHPKVLVLDLNMPGKPVLEAIPGLRKEAPDTQIVVLTMRDDVAFVQEAREAGALGYVLKEAAGSDLVDAIRRAAAGERYLNRRLAERLVVERTRTSSWD
jgi:two-component system, NarL family, response regulator NreC